MNSLTVKAAGKVNLALDVVGKLSNGYHLIESIFQTVGLYDIISVEIIDNPDIILNCSVPYIPCDERNIAYKAVLLFRELTNTTFGCKIHISKNIPSQAGMGGGSADGAGVLYALNKLMGEKYSIEELLPLAQKLGADVPFMLVGGTAYVEGIGEKITKINDYSGKIFLIGKGTGGISTPMAYRQIDSLKNAVHPLTKDLRNAIENNHDNAYKFYGNLFEQATSLDSVNKIKSTMMKNKALNSIMTGSGSAVFGHFENIDDAKACQKILKSNGFFSEVCLTTQESILIVNS